MPVKDRSEYQKSPEKTSTIQSKDIRRTFGAAKQTPAENTQGKNKASAPRRFFDVEKRSMKNFRFAAPV